MLTPRIKRTLLCLIAVFAALVVHADEFDPKDIIIVLGGRVGLIQAGHEVHRTGACLRKGSIKAMELDGPEGTTIPGAKLFALNQESGGEGS